MHSIPLLLTTPIRNADQISTSTEYYRWIPYANQSTARHGQQTASKTIKSSEVGEYDIILRAMIQETASVIKSKMLNITVTRNNIIYTIEVILKQNRLVGNGRGKDTWIDRETYRHAFILLYLINVEWSRRFKNEKQNTILEYIKADNNTDYSLLSQLEEESTQIQKATQDYMSSHLRMMETGPLHCDYNPSDENT